MKHLLLILLLLLPLTLQAKRHKAKPTAQVEHRLTAEEQLRFDALYLEACSQRQCGHPDQAVMLMQRAVEIDSLSAPAMYFLSDCYHAMGRDSRSLWYIRRCVAIDSTCYWYGAAEAELLMDLRQPQSALESYERLARRFPEKDDPLYALAELYLRNSGGQSLDTLSAEKCITTLDKIEELNGVNERVTMQKFYLLHQLGRTDSAFAQYDRLIARYPYNVQYRIQKGDMQMQFGQIREAKQTYDAAALIEPDNAYLWVAQSNYLSIIGDDAAADSLIRAALVNANLDVETKVEVLTGFLKQQLRDSIDTEVDELFNTVERLHPLEPAFYDLHADYLSAIGSDSLASQQMRYAIDLRPTSDDYWTKYLGFSTRLTDQEEVRRRCREGERSMPDLATPYVIEAMLYAEREQPDSAIVAYREALQRTPASQRQQTSRYYGSMGDLFHQLGQQDSTYWCYDEALKYNDQNWLVLNNYAYFLSLEKRDLNRAEQMSLKVIQQYPDNPTYLDTYAWVLYQQGSYFMAQFYQQKAIDAMGDERSSALMEHMGDILVKQNDLKQALMYWQQALECDDIENADEVKDKIRIAGEAVRLME